MTAKDEFKLVVWCVLAVVLAISGLALLGWLFGVQSLKSVRSDWISMRVVTALCLLCCAAALMAAQRRPAVPWSRRLCQALGAGVGLAGLLSLAAYLWALQSGLEPGWVGAPVLRGFFSLPARMAPMTAMIFVGFGAAFLFLGSSGPRGAQIAHGLALPVALMSYLVLISYLLGVNALHTWMDVPVALNTGLACCALSIGLFCVRPGTWFMSVFASREAGGTMARRLLPAVLVVPPTIVWLRLTAEHAGLIALPVGAALEAIGNGLVMLCITWLTARSANLTAEHRRRAEGALHESEERYRSLVEMSPDAVFINRDNRIVQVNPAALSLLGAESPDQIVGKSPFDIFHRDFHATVRERIETLLSGQAVPLIEEKIVRLDGSIRDVEVAASPCREQQRLAVQVILRDITDRKRAEEALRQQREWLRVTLTSIGDAVLATDTAGRVTFLNPVAAKLTGWAEEEALGRPAQDVFRIIHEQTREKADDIVDRVLREGHVVALANGAALLARDGREIPIEDSAAPITDHAGNLAGVVLVFHDVTEKRRAQEALRREGERLRQLNQTLKAYSRSDQALLRATDEAAYLQEVCKIVVEDCGHAMVWVGLAEDDDAKTVRPVAYSGFEQGYLETLKITWADTERGRGPTGSAIRTGKVCMCRNMLTDPAFLPWREQAILRGYASSIVFPLLAGDKTFGALTIYSREPDPFSGDEVKLLTDLAGDVAHGISVLRLRAAHARAAQTLRESEERFRTLAEAIPHSVWVAAPDGRIEYANRLFQDYRGLAAESRDWQVWQDGVHPEDLARCENAWTGFLRTGADVAFEHRLRRASDGAYRWQLGRGRAVRAQDGRVVRLIGTITDIHDQKVAEEAARQAQKLESIGLLAGGIAHDFNNLLTGVIGYASLAEDMLPGGSPVVEILRRIIRSGEQAAHLTSQMLAYAGKGRLFIKPVNLSQLVRETSVLIQSSISNKIAVRLQLPSNLPAVQSDPSQMQQVFMNLALNAGEAIGDNPGVITITTGEVSVDAAWIADELDGWAIEPGRYVFLDVRDTGCGMGATTKARIFDPFFTTKFQGRGLGLAAVAGIVRTHKGAVKLTTAPGAGTTFRVLLPAMASAAAASQPSPERRDDLRGKGTVLVVDDEQIVRDVAKHSLERQGYEVLLAESGPAAIEIVRSEGSRIRLVVLDLSMPGMGGEEALPRLRHLKPDLEVVVSSGYSETETLRLFRGTPVSGFIHKPYTARELAREVKSVLA